MAPLSMKNSSKLVSLPEAFAAGLEAKDRPACIRLLTDYPEFLTRSGTAFEWLKDS